MFAHLHPVNYLVALVGLLSGVVLSLPIATIIGAAITSVGIVIAAWIGKREKNDWEP